jgi:hypothetical protein
VPILGTDSTTTIDGIEHWANGNVTPESKNTLRLILDLYAKPKDQEFANVTKRWDIEWFWKVDKTRPDHDPLSKQQEFYALKSPKARRQPGDHVPHRQIPHSPVSVVVPPASPVTSSGAYPKRSSHS